ncbi:phage tail assembly protein [Pseudomonas huaxiensis]|uniref:phage tail assembly protein n=1 Tax=Pseudomonas huaxiensis TaxID=2213017 RepID=UPI000DA658D2|nr:phage tail assembly protein [Pseudomonas huaxiensis]
MAAPLSITLKFPFTNAAGELITTLPIKRLKRKDLAAAHSFAKGEVAQEDFIFARMTGLTMEDIGELDIADAKVVTEVFRGIADGGDIAEILGRSTAARVEDAAIGDSPADNG